MQDSPEYMNEHPSSSRPGLRSLLPGVALLLILALAAFLRLQGIAWDDYTHLHPDERFLTMVETAIELPSSSAEYFDTAESAFNPYNKGFGFFVYGTFPIFLVRYVGDQIGLTGYDEIYIVGRALSALFDLLTIALVYAIGRRLYRERVGLLAAFFVATAVLLIQHAHFFVVDSIANTFVVAALYFAVRALDGRRVLDYVFFGLSLGLAVASKINTAPAAGLIVLAGLAYASKQEKKPWRQSMFRIAGLWALAAVVSLITFRIFQPYAFEGPSFFNVLPNEQWLSNMAEIRQLNQGNTDAPYALQWANRPAVLFSLKNMVLWGMGIPLGVFAWVSWGWALVQMVRGKRERHLLPVVWTGAYFLWQSTGFTPAMRYQMPVYPTLAILAAWGIFELWGLANDRKGKYQNQLQAGAIAVAGVVVLGTLFWAIAFTSIYRRPLTRVEASRWMYRHIPGVMNLTIETAEGELLETIPMPENFTLEPGSSHTAEVKTDLQGEVTSVLMPFVSSQGSEPRPAALSVRLVGEPTDSTPIATSSFSGLLSEGEQRLDLPLNTPVTISPERRLFLVVENTGSAPIFMRGTYIIHETTWDDGLPWGVDGRGMGGRYEERNLQLYWDDDQDDDQDGVPDKLERIVQALDEADYLAISSNRQYGTIPRVPIRYPLTTAFYRALFGCPPPRSVVRCGAEAEVGSVKGDLGYDLIEVFESNPRLGPIEISDQLAEEAFTVYDHPKVLIFKKAPDFSRKAVEALLMAVDVSRVQHVLPKEAGSPARDLLLSPERWDEQRRGGTWSQLFPQESLINRSALLAVVVWWLFITMIGVIAFPIVRLAFPGLTDSAYPLMRLGGMLLFAWGAWMAGSLGIPETRTTLALVLLAIATLSGVLAYRQREDLLAFLKRHRREILWTELFALSFFLFDLAIRLGNPDLWHPAYGGEKPMDFSYLNAVLKSTTFPPFDPWFAGGYINYYYFGFVLVGMPVKLLGLTPSIAYNLILPTLFSLLGLSGYSVAYNLVAQAPSRRTGWGKASPRLAGFAAALMLVVLGNLGTARMLYEGLRTIGSTGEPQARTPLAGPLDALRGAGRFLTFQENMPYPLHQWYWNPSRAIEPANGEAGPITEFPFFTFLYADLHAHMISRSLTVASLAWGISWVFFAESEKRKVRRRWLIPLLFGGLMLGALKPTNTWDYPVYWAFAILAVAYASWRRRARFDRASALEFIAVGALLLSLAQFLYQPYHIWYGQGYASASFWKGSHTGLTDYLTVHGLFLFILFSWLTWESVRWMAETPLSSLAELKPYQGYLGAAGITLVAIVGLMLGLGYDITLLALPGAIWAGVLMLRPGQLSAKRVPLAFISVAFLLTLLVELVVLRGDIDRMNTVFKFYLQVWELFSLASGAALAWLMADLNHWKSSTVAIWRIATYGFFLAAAFYPLLAGLAKVRDRMAPDAPHTLDGMAYMAYADDYYELGHRIDLAQEYHAIRWMQRNVQGSPVIVEANVPEYRWGSRFTIYTGLPGVLGWRWHQTQQRVAAPNNGVDQRLFDITDFYLTTSVDEAEDFLDRYDVEYVIVGQLEKVYYETIAPCYALEGEGGVYCDHSGRPMGMRNKFDVDPAECWQGDANSGETGLTCPTHGLEKFAVMEKAGLLEKVYSEADTIIYGVLR